MDELEYYKERRRFKAPGLVGEQGEIIFWEYKSKTSLNVKILRPLLSGRPFMGFSIARKEHPLQIACISVTSSYPSKCNQTRIRVLRNSY